MWWRRLLLLFLLGSLPTFGQFEEDSDIQEIINSLNVPVPDPTPTPKPKSKKKKKKTKKKKNILNTRKY